MLKYESKRIRFKKTELVYFFLEETTYEKTWTRVLHNKFFIILSITINKVEFSMVKLLLNDYNRE